MANLVLTQEEKDAKSYLEWDDASLGRLCKRTMIFIEDNAVRIHSKDDSDHDVVVSKAAALLLIRAAIDLNAQEASFKMDGVTIAGKSAGSWIVKINDLDEKQQEESPKERAVELTIAARVIGWRQRLQTALTGWKMAASSLAFGRFSIVVRKYHKIEELRRVGS